MASSRYHNSNPPAFPISIWKRSWSFLFQDDLAAFIDYAPGTNIHAACGLLGSPVPQVTFVIVSPFLSFFETAQAADPAAAQLRLWVRTQFTDASPICNAMVGSTGAPSTSVFHRLSATEWGDLVNSGAAFHQWLAAMYAAGASLGHCIGPHQCLVMAMMEGIVHRLNTFVDGTPSRLKT